MWTCVQCVYVGRGGGGGRAGAGVLPMWTCGRCVYARRAGVLPMRTCVQCVYARRVYPHFEAGFFLDTAFGPNPISLPPCRRILILNPFYFIYFRRISIFVTPLLSKFSIFWDPIFILAPSTPTSTLPKFGRPPPQ